MQKSILTYHSLVLKAVHLSGFAFCNFRRLEVPEQTLGIGFGLLWKINFRVIVSIGRGVNFFKGGT